jgi:hypothetical protein
MIYLSHSKRSLVRLATRPWSWQLPVAKGCADNATWPSYPFVIVPLQDRFLSFAHVKDVVMDRCTDMLVIAGVGCSSMNPLKVPTCQASSPLVRVCIL